MEKIEEPAREECAKTSYKPEDGAPTVRLKEVLGTTSGFLPTLEVRAVVKPYEVCIGFYDEVLDSPVRGIDGTYRMDGTMMDRLKRFLEIVELHQRILRERVE